MMPVIQQKPIIFRREKHYLFVMKVEPAQFWSEFQMQRPVLCKERRLHESNAFFLFVGLHPNPGTPAVLKYF